MIPPHLLLLGLIQHHLHRLLFLLHSFVQCYATMSTIGWALLISLNHCTLLHSIAKFFLKPHLIMIWFAIIAFLSHCSHLITFATNRYFNWLAMAKRNQDILQRPPLFVRVSMASKVRQRACAATDSSATSSSARRCYRFARPRARSCGQVKCGRWM